jgi:hypothetical protein
MVKLDNFLIISYATLETPYVSIINKYLMPSLETFKLPHHIEIIENQGSWLKNVAMKPQVILNCFEKYPSKDLVCIDADAEILQYPKLFNEIPEEYDIACHILDWDSWYGYTNHVKELLTGTIFIRNNEKTKELVKKWYTLSTSSGIWEQKVLQQLIEENKDIKVYALPLSYCYIVSLPDGSKPLIELDPIILHHQSSREFKKQIKKLI